MSHPIRIYLIEDFQIIRDGVKALLSMDPEIRIVGDAADSRALQTNEATDIDVVIIDIHLDGLEGNKTLDGFEVCTLLKQRYPGIKIILHSAYDGSDQVARAMKLGASGFVSKKSGVGELVNAIKAVYNGKTYICQSIAHKLKNLNQFLDGYDGTLKEKNELFSKREREVLELLAQGFSTDAIAEKLFITSKTVESHRKHLVLKAEVKNTNQLIAYAYSRGILNK